MALTTKQKRLQRENQRYWDRREREALQHQKLRSKAETYDTHIRRTLEHTLEQAQKEIDAFFRKYAGTEGISIEEAKRRASNFDIEAFASKAKEYVETKNFSDEANEALRLYNLTMRVNRLELLKAQIGLDMVDDFNELQQYFDKELTEDTLAELRRQAGILGETVIDPAGKASEIVNGTWYNARLSERIWLQQDLLRFQLEGLLTDGILQGKNPRVLARELKKKFDTTIYNCQRLMRTELARVQIGAQQAEYAENDVEEFEFIANSTACPICSALDGKHFKVKDLVIAKNAPPMHPNCMCSTAPWEEGFGDLPPEELAPEADGPKDLQKLEQEAEQKARAPKELTQDEKDAAEYYVSGEGMWINQYLRGDTGIGELDDGEKMFLEDLRSATNRPLPEGVDKLFRSVDASAIFGTLTDMQRTDLYSYIGDSNSIPASVQKLIDITKGAEITEKGFMSTTTDRDIAMDFGSFTGAQTPVIIEFNKLSDNVRGADLSMFDIAEDQQKEILLHTDMKYKITDISIKDGQLYITAAFL